MAYLNADKAVKDGIDNGNQSKKGQQLTVTGYIMRDNVKVRRIDLMPEEQQRLAITWTTKAMRKIGYEPTSEYKGVI